MSAKLQRPLRVLDLGCCTGYISLSISSWGGDVTGVDHYKYFLDLGKFLAGEHPDYKIKFVYAEIQEFIPKIKNDEYDLVLGLSLFHWVTKKIGFQRTQKLFATLAEKITVGLFEFSLASEFPDIKLPKNYQKYLKDYFFVRVLKYYTWSSKREFRRPLCFAANKYAHFDDLGILKIDEVPRKNRKHFICGDKFIKIMNSKNAMLQNEIQFLQEFAGQNGLPKLHTILQENDEESTRTFIIRDNIKGLPLNKAISENPNLDMWDFIEQLLRWMIFFEKHGYYQTDLIPSNFIYNEVGKIIPVDYGLMIHEPISHRWPFNIRLNFIHFMTILLEKEVNREIVLFFRGKNKYYSLNPLLTTFGQYVSDDKYRRILALHDDEKFFENLYEILFSPLDPLSKVPRKSFTISEVEVLEKEQAVRDLWIIAEEQQKRIEQLEKIINEKLK